MDRAAVKASTLDAESFLGYLRCGPEMRDLVALWPLCPDRLTRALDAAGVIVDDREAIEVWVRLDEQLAAAERRRIDVEDHPAIIDAATAAALAPEPGLHVDEDLVDLLPLLELAEDLARRSPGRRLTVERHPGDAIGVRGYFTRSSYAALVVLDAALEGQELVEVWAHELAHGLDPDLDGVDGLGIEAFAEALAPLLLEVEPGTVAEAGFLVARALEEASGCRRSRPTSGSVGGVLRWALADAGVVVVAVPETVAACGHRARDAGRASSPAQGEGHHAGCSLASVPGPVEPIRGESRDGP